MFTPAAKNLMLTALPPLFCSLHTAFPGTTGLSELSGGSPAYARLSATFGTASGGARTLSGSLTFNVGAGNTVSWIGFWDALTLGNFVGYSPNGGVPKEFVTDTLANNIRSPGHGYAANQMIVFYNGTVPGGVTQGTAVFVINPTADTFQVAATSGGVAIAITTNASQDCYMSAITPVSYGSQSTHMISTGSQDLNR